jgi:hypothetical protein
VPGAELLAVPGALRDSLNLPDNFADIVPEVVPGAVPEAVPGAVPGADMVGSGLPIVSDEAVRTLIEIVGAG